MLVIQYIFITRWTPVDFPWGWCCLLGMYMLSLEIMTRNLLGCQQWKSREFCLLSILYLLQFSETVLKIKQVYSFSTTRLNWNIFHSSKDARLWLLVISQCNSLYGSSVTHVQVINSHRNKITVTFWKCKDQTWSDTKFWYEFKGQLVKIVAILDPMATF